MNELKTNTYTPWLSIIIPVYNAEKYLHKCIRSVLSQAFQDFELILVDDDSTDNSSVICKEFASKDKRIRYYHKVNGGSLKARVYGALKSEGQYILYCDADDYYCNDNAFSKLYDLVQMYGCDFIEFGYYKHFNYLKRKYVPTEHIELVNEEQFKIRDYPKLLCSSWEESRITTTVWDKLYHKELFGYLPDVDAFSKIFMGDDIIMNLYLLEHVKSALYYPQVFYNYQVKTGASHQWKKEAMLDLNQIKSYQLSFYERYIGTEDTKKEIKRILHSEAVYWLFAHIKEGIAYVDDETLSYDIKGYLELPCFKKAREYFTNEDMCDWLAIKLFREADPKQYVKEAHNQQERITFKIKALNWLRNHI